MDGLAQNDVLNADVAGVGQQQEGSPGHGSSAGHAEDEVVQSVSMRLFAQLQQSEVRRFDACAAFWHQALPSLLMETYTLNCVRFAPCMFVSRCSITTACKPQAQERS